MRRKGPAANSLPRDGRTLLPARCRYCLSTSLSLWNKILVGEGRGLFGKGPFPGVETARGGVGGWGVGEGEGPCGARGWDPA